MEGVQVVLRVHAALQPDRVGAAFVPPVKGLEGLSHKARRLVQDVSGVKLAMARSHVPGHLVPSLLDVCPILHHGSPSCTGLTSSKITDGD